MQPTRSELKPTFFPVDGTTPVEWMIADRPVDYETSVQFMEARAIAIAKGEAKECVVLLEHPALYTAGTSADQADLIDPDRFPIFSTGRGGQYTYHGPGQRVAYTMLNLSKRRQDVRAYVAALENWIISTLGSFNVKGERRETRVGVWVTRPEKALVGGAPAEDKIAAIGVRLKRWVSLHGLSINVEPDLEHFSGIIPCGVDQHGVTSLVDLGLPVTMMDLDVALKENFELIFGPTQPTLSEL